MVDILPDVTTGLWETAHSPCRLTPVTIRINIPGLDVDSDNFVVCNSLWSVNTICTWKKGKQMCLCLFEWSVTLTHICTSRFAVVSVPRISTILSMFLPEPTVLSILAMHPYFQSFIKTPTWCHRVSVAASMLSPIQIHFTKTLHLGF